MPGWRRWLPVSAVGGIVAALLTASEFGFALEEDVGLGMLFRLRGPVQPPEDVVVLRLDNDSLAVLRGLSDRPDEWPAPLAGCAGRYPELVVELLQVAGLDRLPRRLQACVVDLASAAGAATIIYDVAFPASIDRPPGTSELAAAIARHRKVVLREATRRDHPNGAALQLYVVTPTHPDIAAAAAGVATSRLPEQLGRINQFWVMDPASPTPLQLAGRAVEVAISDSLERLAALLGRAPPSGLAPDEHRQWLVEAALAALASGRLPAELSPADRFALEALRRVHAGPSHLYFNFYGPPGTLPTLSLWELLSQDRPDILAGAHLFVGAANLTTSSERDTFHTVVTTDQGVRMSGVELWATAFANLRNGTALRVLPEWRRIGIMLLVGLIIMVLAQATDVVRGMLLAVVATAAWIALAIGAFVVAGFWLPFVGLAIILPGAALAAALLRFRRARLSAVPYLTKRVADRIFDETMIPTTWLDATVLITDIVGFSALAQHLERQGRGALRDFQNRHLRTLEAFVIATGGEVIEQTGDGMLALWSGPAHAASAGRAALGIAAAIARDNERRPEGEEPLRLRIGINTGPITVGEIGGGVRRFVTCSGDTVNMTERLQSLGKTLCPDRPTVAILIGQGTAAELGASFRVELIAQEVLRGHPEPEPVYRLWPPPAAPRFAKAAAAVLLALLTPGLAVAAPPCESAVARLVASQGTVTVQDQVVEAGSGGVPLCADAVIVVERNSRATLHHLSGDTMLALEANSRLRVIATAEPQSGLVELLHGTLFFISQVRRTLTVRTPTVDAGIEGTEVLVAVGGPGEPALDLRVYDGRVAVRPTAAAPATAGLPAEPLIAGDRLLIAADGAVDVARGDVASLRLAAARELAWTLYYPPLFPDLSSVPMRLADASRLLSAGRVEEARATLAEIPDGSPDAPSRDALLAVIAVSQGDAAGGLTLAEAAVARRATAATLLARSYAEQALRRLEDARESARAATEAEPANALAWARLAELELSFGNSRAARAAADRSVNEGTTPLVHVVQGFARLSAFDARGAEASFAMALDRDSSQPLAHLGRGLALIRRNQLEEGRRALEVAAGLDPARSLLRSYLGKAYFEERRDQDAADQLRIAKELDPDDPTPWLYSAIQKQLGNRPVEALRDLERSIELNDNRATFRSGLLLDEDRATRGVSLARIYNSLGFQRLGQIRAAQALVDDPANAAAHQFLADLYQDLPRREIAQVSELLQARVYAPVGSTILEPSRIFADLDLGPRSMPLGFSLADTGQAFVRDGIYAGGSVEVGSKSTFVDEVTGQARYGRSALNVGQFHGETNNFRRNDELRNDVVELLGEQALGSRSKVQLSYTERHTSEGDRLRRFPELTIPSFHRSLREKVLQAAIHAAPGAGHDVGLAITDLRRDDHQRRREQSIGGVDQFTDGYVEGLQIDAQSIDNWGPVTTIAGFSAFDLDTDLFTKTNPDVLGGSLESEDSDQGVNPYVRANLRVASGLTAVFGLGYGWIDQPDEVTKGWEPQFGLYWLPSSSAELRLAAARTTKRPLLVNQTLQSSQLVGFDLLFDESNGVRADLLGIGGTLRLGESLWIDSQAVRRWLAQTLTDSSNQHQHDDQTEDEISLGTYWLPTDSLALGLELDLIKYRIKTKESGGQPARTLDNDLTASARYFWPSGWFADASLTLFRQEVESFTSDGQLDSDKTFTTVDATIGYQARGGWGIVALQVLNLFDTRVDYVDDSFRTSFRESLPFAEERLVLFKAALRF